MTLSADLWGSLKRLKTSIADRQGNLGKACEARKKFEEEMEACILWMKEAKVAIGGERRKCHVDLLQELLKKVSSSVP